jgi:hypothetical protein
LFESKVSTTAYAYGQVKVVYPLKHGYTLIKGCYRKDGSAYKTIHSGLFDEDVPSYMHYLLEVDELQLKGDVAIVAVSHPSSHLPL